MRQALAASLDVFLQMIDEPRDGLRPGAVAREPAFTFDEVRGNRFAP